MGYAEAMARNTAHAHDFDTLYAQLCALPEHQVGEILDGQLEFSPRPALAHATSNLRLGSDLDGQFGRSGGGRPGGWVILVEPELHLEAGGRVHVLVPDLAGWRRERLPLVPRQPYLSLAPDWICEIRSPSTARRDRTIKARIYHEAGVGHAWYIDPDAQLLEVFRREGAFWVFLGAWGGEDVVRAEPFDAVELRMADWWEGVEPPPPQEP